MAKIRFIEVYLSDGTRTIINENLEVVAYDQDDNKTDKIPKIPLQILAYCKANFAKK